MNGTTSDPLKVLAVVAHPDDEILGCGATLARHADQGHEVEIIIMADGVGARQTSSNAETGKNSQSIAQRRDDSLRAAKILGTSPPNFLDLPDNRMDSLPLLEVIQALELQIKKFQPSLIYTHHGNDLNVDHRITYQSVLTACRPVPDSVINGILCFETLSSTEWSDPGLISFQPVHFVDVETTLERKLSAMACYEHEMRPFPHTRSPQAVTALARLRGSQCGRHAAEAFSVIRTIL